MNGRRGSPPPAGLAQILLVTRRTVEFGCAIVIVDLLAGVAGAATAMLLHDIKHLTYHYSFGTLLRCRRKQPCAACPMIGGRC